MADVEWDADNFEPVVDKLGTATAAVKTDKWVGEDDDDETLRDNWDDEEEKTNKSAERTVAAVQVAKKKPLKDKISEKSEQKKKELEEKRKQEEEARKLMTPKELQEEKRRRQKIEEENDLALAIDAFGLGKMDDKPVGLIDAFEPSSKEEFDKFSELLCSKITKYEKSPHYESFIESLYQKLALGLEAEAIKKLSSSLTILSNEKAKQQKGPKTKKKNLKASLVVGKDTGVDLDDAIYEEFEDYL